MTGSFLAAVSRRPLTALLVVVVLVVCAVLAGIYAYAGVYGFNVIFRRGGTIWVSVKADDPRLSPSMRLALGNPVPSAEPGQMQWKQVDAGFDVAELPAIAGGAEVDRILLARIDATRFRFEVRNGPAGDRELDDWMRDLGAVLVINGSYFSHYGTPDTPFLSNGVLLGPKDYDAKHGAFVASPTFVGIRDLAKEDWHDALRGAENAMVSYPLLLAPDGSSRVGADQGWLANRSFVGQDRAGRLILGTTKDAFFTLGRLADFLRRSPLDLLMVLNLDGGPVACQGIALNNYRRSFCGDWEFAVKDGDLQLLQPVLGVRRWGLPIVLAVHRK